MELTPVQVRVLGSLIEKELATPDYYPLTLNALRAACNQTSNRNPVMNLEEHEIASTLDELRAANLTRIVFSRSNRAEKYRHALDEALRLEEEDRAALAVLLLRGPQTASEVRARAERMHAFAEQAECDGVLDRMAGRDEPLVVHLPRQPGQKEARWAHVLAGEPDVSMVTAAAPRRPADPGLGDRVAALEEEVARLRTEVEELRALYS
jgi:uncharacterized protein